MNICLLSFAVPARGRRGLQSTDRKEIQKLGLLPKMFWLKPIPISGILTVC